MDPDVTNTRLSWLFRGPLKKWTPLTIDLFRQVEQKSTSPVLLTCGGLEVAEVRVFKALLASLSSVTEPLDCLDLTRKYSKETSKYITSGP